MSDSDASPFDRPAKRGRRRPYPKGRQLDTEALDEVVPLLDDVASRPDLLIEFLHRLQDRFGFLSARHLNALANHMGLAQAEVYEVATFYAHFDVLKEDEAPPPPLTVRVCDGIACEMAGCGDLFDTVAKRLGSDVRVVRAPCVGACDKAPVAVLGHAQIPRATPASVAAAVAAGQAPATEYDTTDFETYTREGGYRTLGVLLDDGRTREDVIATIEEAGLRGLGGAGFPAARKWRFVLAEPKPRYLAINADEGEPGTFKDRHCLEIDPHRVLEGALIAAWAIEAEAVYIYLRDEYPVLHRVLHREIARIEQAGLTDGIELIVRRGAGSYVCGEESAMLESLEGKRGLPRNRPPYPAQAGLFGRPTLINNVETLFWLRDILEKGAEWYRDAGHPHFYSVSGRVKEPGLKTGPGHGHRPPAHRGVLGRHGRRPHLQGLSAGRRVGRHIAGQLGGRATQFGSAGGARLLYWLGGGGYTLGPRRHPVRGSQPAAFLRGRELRPVHALPTGDRKDDRALGEAVLGRGPA